MCDTAVYSSLFFTFILTTTIISIMCGTKMASEGLPIPRREHGADNDDLLSGVDFLSVLMGSSLRRSYRETTTSAASTLYNEPITQQTFPVTTTTISPIEDLITSMPDLEGQKSSVVRESRSTQSFLSPSFTTPLDVLSARTTYEVPQSTSVYDNNQLLIDNNNNNNVKDNNKKSSSDSNDLNEGVVVAVHVSSSVGRTLINKIQEKHIEDTTLRETTKPSIQLTTNYSEKNLISSEEQPSIIVESNKSDFNVEEREPITTNSDLNPSEYANNFANAHALPRISSQSSFNSGYLAQELIRDNTKNKLQPFHQTVIFHNNPRESGRARSVSYSTVIQAVPHSQTNKNWEGEKLQPHDRQERHYDGTQTSYANNFDNLAVNKPKINDTNKFVNAPSVAETNNYFVTTNPEHPNHNIEKNWEKPERVYQQPETSTRKTILTTERNWEIPEKPYTPPSHHQQLPTVYGRPEQNYEIDESVSVVSNGRVHGVQPQNQLKQSITTDQSNINTNSNNDGKKDDNQKVGYVVEGRNYRKYRVEERTSDGFIVGEYGVVSHDDGSLRGVRYTADGTTNPRLIYDALMKFLSL